MKTQASPAVHEGTWEKVVLVGAGALVVLALILWVTGELAGFLSSGKWNATGLSQMGKVVGRITHTLSDPSEAWPRRSRANLAGPLLFYSVFACLMVIAALAVRQV